jgi:hypothetical protein
MKRLEHNVQTGEIIEIEMSADEIKQFEAKAAAEADRIAAIEQPTLEVKLNNAGITLDELKAALGL